MELKMVLTRSSKKSDSELLSLSDTDEISNEKSTTNLFANLLGQRINKLMKKKKKKENGDDDEDDSSLEFDSEEDEEEFDIPSRIQQDKNLLIKINKIIKYIETKEPTLEKILQLKCRWEKKIEIFELFYIYKYSPLNTQERLEYKKIILEKITLARKDYKIFIQHKEMISNLENKYNVCDEILDIKQKILNLNANENEKYILFKKYKELESIEIKDEEYQKQKSWLSNALQLPYNNYMKLDLTTVSDKLLLIKDILDKELYGMREVKEQIMLFINNKFYNPNMKGCCLGLVGPPGVGKTSIAMCLSKILSVPFEQIPLGGIVNSESMKGHDSVYVGSKPGQISQAMMKLNYKNGILFFDEFDKINKNENVVNTMLHITDFKQNHLFRDNYFDEINIDLSSLWFIYSMNEKPTNKALADRIYYVHIDGYNMKDKIQIVKNYILPKLLLNLNLKKDDIIIDENVSKYFIMKTQSEDEKGIRSLDKGIQELISKILFMISNQDKLNVSFELPKSYFPFNFPVTIDETIINTFVKKQKTENFFQNLYV
jgi:ATP-dependent Lon protease